MLSELQEQRIVRAIANAERGNRGEVRVHIEARCAGDPRIRAQRVYGALGLSNTVDDTGVLVYVASDSRVAVVLSGAGVPDQAPGFWQEVVDEITAGYRKDQPEVGICAALERVGTLLREVVGGQDAEGNELADAVTTGRVGEEERAVLPYTGPVVDELNSDAFACINCGAPMHFPEEDESSSSADAACEFCHVVNPKAAALLRKRRLKQRQEERASAERRRQLKLFVGLATAGLMLVLLLASWRTSSGLREEYAEVERARAQVTNVRERQQAVHARYEKRTDSPERDAELSGSENRVRIERARYDQAASNYNAAVGTGWSKWCASLYGLPVRADLSNEVSW